MIGGLGLLPVGVCARCGLRGIPLALASCPRCGAVYGWLQVDRAACAVFLVALWIDRRETIRRHVMEAASPPVGWQLAGQPGRIGMVVNIAEPTPLERAVRAQQLAHPNVPLSILYRQGW